MHSSIILSKNDDEFIFRELKVNDEKNLGRFFLNLSTNTKSKFGPHPLTMECAYELCNVIDATNIQRFIAVKDEEIAGYFILDFNKYAHETARYQQNSIILESGLDPVFAPCIADKYQNSGIASSAMSLIIKIAQQANLRRIVLMGGTQETNILARSFYSKFGFKEYGTFYTDYNQLNNIDMMLELNCK